MKIRWRAVVRYKGMYSVSQTGKVKSRKRLCRHMHGTRLVRERILKAGVGSHGYLNVVLNRGNKSKTFSVHKLVAKAFIPNPDNLPEVNHKDGNKLNNHVSNLEWVTHQENAEHAVAIGLYPLGDRHWNSKLKEKDIPKIRKLLKAKKQIKRIAKQFSISRAVIHSIRDGKTWVNA